MSAQFLGIGVGETREGAGIRVEVAPGGDKVWMHGKWLELADHHAVAWIEGNAEFVRPDGKVLLPGQFPAWSVRSTKRGGPFALMFDRTQFLGGELRIKRSRKLETTTIA